MIWPRIINLDVGKLGIISHDWTMEESGINHSRGGRVLLQVCKRHGLGPFVSLVTAVSVGISELMVGASALLFSYTRAEIIYSLLVAAVVPLVIAAPTSLLVGRLLVAVDRVAGELEVLARTDSLTNVRNRRAFVEDASQLLEQRFSMKDPAKTADVVVAMIDVDNFKQLNDRHGHAKGDAALIMVARQFSECAGGKAVLGRMGGDEFAIVALSERATVDSLIESFDRAADLGNFHSGLRCSVGTAVLSGPVTLAEALSNADFALYRVKASRDQRVGTPDAKTKQALPPQHFAGQQR
jgi:diguanylate cyclase (GGDEF)-like protein